MSTLRVQAGTPSLFDVFLYESVISGNSQSQDHPDLMSSRLPLCIKETFLADLVQMVTLLLLLLLTPLPDVSRPSTLSVHTLRPGFRVETISDLSLPARVNDRYVWLDSKW